MTFNQRLTAIKTVIKNLIIGGNIISLTMVLKPKRMIGYVSEILFFYKAFNSKRGLPQKNVYKVLPSENIESIKLGGFKDGGTWFSQSSFLTDIINLSLICQIIKPKIIFEIGTFYGYTSFHFALNSPDDTIIYTLDLPIDEKLIPELKTTLVDESHIKNRKEIVKFSFSNTFEEKKIIRLFGDSATYDFSDFWGKVDLFFIDGAHSYDYVRSDTLNALKCCHKGSIIVWHDYGRVGVNGVSKWLHEFSKEREIFSISGGSLAYMVIK
jgi:hypothetical protein